MSTYTDFRDRTIKADVVVGNGQCVALVVNNSNAYVEALYPGINWTTIIPSVWSAKQMAGKSNQYLTWVPNDHNNPNQLPPQGAIGIFDATPQAGYTNQTNNPDGHTGIFDNADSSGYSLFQENSPTYGAKPNVTRYAWKFRPCLGWYVPTGYTTPPPMPQPASTGKILHLAPTNNDFHLYPVGGPYVYSASIHTLSPRSYPGGIDERIITDRGNGIFTVQTQMYGAGDLYTKGSDITIN